MAAEVRCPMCSKQNPADAEDCRYCGARLKPVWSLGQGDAPAEQPGEENAAEGAVPDWLRQLRAESPAEPETPPDPGAPDGDVPDWLAHIRQQADGEEDTSSGLFAADDGVSEPDWMKGDTGAAKDAESAAEFGGDDWLSRLGDSGEPPSGGAALPEGEANLPAAEPESEADPTSALSAWLKSLEEGEGQAPASAENQPPAPEWTGLDNRLFADETPAESAEEPPQWASLAGEVFGDSAPDTATGDEHTEVPQWSFESSEEQDTLQAGVSGEEYDSEFGGIEEPLPDWLSASSSDAPPADGLPDKGENAVPTWLSDFESSEPEISEPATPEFAALAADAFTSSEPEPAASTSSEEAGLPAWLGGDFGSEAAPVEEEPAAPEPQTAPQPEGELPAWFAAFDEAQPEASDQTAGGEAPGPFAAPGVEEPALAGAEQPDWLQSLGAAADEPEAVEEPAPAAPPGPLPFIEEDMPAWLSEFQGQPAAESGVPPLISAEESQPPSAVDDSPFAVDLPAWLGEEAEQQRALAGGEGGEAAAPEEELAQAELPSWVAAMRPVETAISGEAGAVESDQRVERAGPLAGMRGVLPAEDAVVRYRKPPVYSAKLRLTEKQRMSASLLDGILAQETQPLLIPAARTRAPQVIARVLVALVLFVVLGGMLLAGVQPMPTPELYPPEIINLYEQVESLPVDAPVLLAVDYEPGLSGEMRFASAMVIDHLMAKNARLTIVSTVPTGPALADRLLRDVRRQHAEYDLDRLVVNLGYLPGGTISLLEFAREPQEAAPKSVDGQNAWGQPALAGVQGIGDFARIVLLTDRAEAGRDWVEQVQPFLGEVPLLIVSSAQAGPLLEPFVESDQVQGMVSGLMGGTMYGQRTGRQVVNPALGHYGAYQVGALLAFFLVLFGAIFSAVMSVVGRKAKDRE